MIKTLRLATRGLLAASLAVVFSHAPAQAAEKMRLAHGLPEDNPVHIAMKHFADAVKQRTNGEIEITVFPNGQLGQERELLEQVQNGVLEMTKANAAPLETFVLEYKVFNLPYVFRNKDHFFNVVQGAVGDSILAASTGKGFVGLTFYDSGSRSFYAKKPINTPDDLKGMKIRIQQSPTTIKMIRALGASPTPMPWGEVYSALQMGVVDGAENNLTALTSGRHGEVTKFFSTDEHQIVPDVLVISATKWNTLKKPQRDAIRAAAKESFELQKKLWADFELAERAKAEKMGVKFVTVDKAPFVAKVKPMIDTERKNTKIASLLDQISAVK
ncbi:MAG: TRAP transporter substrate-binding protein [Rhodocyclaceae bacterium]